MRTRILLLLLVFSCTAVAQNVRTMEARDQVGLREIQLPSVSAEMAHRHQARLALLRPTARSWAMAQARIEEMRGRLDINALQAAIRQRFAGSASQNSVEQMAFIVLMLMVQDTQNDLQQEMDEVKAQTMAKQALRSMLQKIDQELAAETAASANRSELNVPCQTAFCRTLPARVSEINAAVKKVNPRSFRSKFQPRLNYSGVVEQQGRVALDSDTITYSQVRYLKTAVLQLESYLLSDAECNAQLQSQVQLAQQAYSQASMMQSNIAKSNENAIAAELQNLK